MVWFMEKRGSGGECQITKRRNLFALDCCRKGMRYGFEVLGFSLLRFELLLSKVLSPKRMYEWCTWRVEVRIWCQTLDFGSVPGQASDLVQGLRVWVFTLLSLMPSSKNRKTARERESMKKESFFEIVETVEWGKGGRQMGCIEEPTEVRFTILVYHTKLSLDEFVLLEFLLGTSPIQVW